MTQRMHTDLHESPHPSAHAPQRFATIQRMNSAPWMEHMTLLAYRLANYAITHLIDEPAMLALIFC